MDLATAIKIGKGAAKVANKVKKYIELDARQRIYVKRDIVLGRFREEVEFPDGSRRAVPDFLCPDFEIRDRWMTVFKTGDRDPFCDGMSMFPDKILTLDFVKAALGHDAGYAYMEEIAKAWGWKVEDVRWLFDAMFGNLLEDEAGRQGGAAMRAAGGVISRLCYGAVRLFGMIYHRHKGKLAALALCVCLAGGCTIPDVFDPSDDRPEYERREAVQRVLDEDYLAAVAAGAVPDGGLGFSSETPATAVSYFPANGQQMAQTADAVDFASLDWCWGGFNGKKAAPVAGCEIADLRVSPSGLSYKWRGGGCEALGATSKGDTDHTIAALFCRADGKWKGGKFDWISTSRTTRDFKNIRGGYHGWDRTAIDRADAYAFVIVSKDGRKRTNVITCGR